MPGPSLRILIALVSGAVLLSGWIFAWQWKREVAGLRRQLEGSAFTQDEQILINLQNQLTTAREENARLSAELQKLRQPVEAPEANREE